MIGSVSRVTLALQSIRAAAVRDIERTAGGAAMQMRMRGRRVISYIQAASFTARIRSISGTFDTYA